MAGTLVEMLRLAPGPKKKKKPTLKTGTSKDDLELAIKEYESNKSAKSFKALLDLAADYQGEQED